jgi:site-specific DNA-methyltransferase (adenine-specific)
MKVIDTHLGGGSNRISCDKLGYEFVACEIDPEYYHKQERKFAEYKSQHQIEFTL